MDLLSIEELSDSGLEDTLYVDLLQAFIVYRNHRTEIDQTSAQVVFVRFAAVLKTFKMRFKFPYSTQVKV